MKVKIKALSLKDLRDKYPNEFYQYNPWWLTEEFAWERPEAGEYDVQFLVKGSLNKSRAAQQKLVKDGFIPTASILFQAALAYKQKNGQLSKSLGGYRIRISEKSAEGYALCASFFLGGFNVDYWAGRAHSAVGVASARKLSLEPQKPESSEDLNLEIYEILINGKKYRLVEEG